MAKVTLLSVREEMRQKRRVADSAWISFQHDSRRRESGGKAELSNRGHEAKQFIRKQFSHLQHIKEVTQGKKAVFPC